MTDAPVSKAEIEEGLTFRPKFGSDGLMPCIVSSATDGAILMLAYMNRESLDLSLKTGEAHYWSRSRNEIWHKGATSGQTQKIVSIQTDCDQDCLLMVVDMPQDQKSGQEISCHTGRRSCFYRALLLNGDGESQLVLLHDPRQQA
jgi:phosphoribosyl-AMP cyclohydrolase